MISVLHIVSTQKVSSSILDWTTRGWQAVHYFSFFCLRLSLRLSLLPCPTMDININIPQLPLDTYIALGLVIATPWLYYLFFPYKKFTTRDQVLSLLLLIHTLYTLHALLVAQPPNIFKLLDLPPNVAPDYLREELVGRLGGGEQNVTTIPPYLDTLLKRLGSMDMRLLYFRYVDNF